MARCLIVGCGCRGLTLARRLRADGHAIRATTRDPARAEALAREGLDARVADPDRVASISPALEHVGILCVLLGSASGTPEAIRELHAGRLEMLLLRSLDSTVRGIVYEAAGTVDATVLRQGAERVTAFCAESRIPSALIEATPEDHEGWLTDAALAVARALEPWSV